MSHELKPGQYPASLYENWWGKGKYCHAHSKVNGEGFFCTREISHSGRHAAHNESGNGPNNYICEVWGGIDPDMELDEGL